MLVFALRGGHSKSCGCWKRELASRQAKQRWTIHGKTADGNKEPLYLLWLRIRKRCSNPQAHNYKWYGARGIKVWDGWQEDAGAFIRYIEENLGPRPEGMSLDRIDNDGNYEPGNLRWATIQEQMHNRRRTGPLSMPIPAGTRFGNWTVMLDDLRKRDASHRVILCRCDCNTEREVLLFLLRSGRSKSCGCNRKSKLRLNGCG